MQCNKRLKYTAAHIVCSVLNEKSHKSQRTLEHIIVSTEYFVTIWQMLN